MELVTVLMFFGLMFVSMFFLICLLIRFQYWIVPNILDKSNDSIVVVSMKRRWATLVLLMGIDGDHIERIRRQGLQRTIRKYRIFCGLLLVGVVVGWIGMSWAIDADAKSRCPRGTKLENCSSR